jgi:hypothetical protein
MKDMDDAQLKADVDEIMIRVKQIMDRIETLAPGRTEDDAAIDEST